MKGYLTDPYFSLTQMLNFSWQAWKHILKDIKMYILIEFLISQDKNIHCCRRSAWVSCQVWSSCPLLFWWSPSSEGWTFWGHHFTPFFTKVNPKWKEYKPLWQGIHQIFFAASHTVLSKVIQEASDKGLVKLPEKSFQRPPNANDAPEGWPAYCYFIGWLFTLLCIAGRMHVTLSSCVRDHFLHQEPRKK